MMARGTTKLIIGRPLSVRIRPLESAGVRCRPLSVQVVWFVRPLCGRTNADGQRTDADGQRTDSGRMRTDSGRTADGRYTYGARTM